MCGLQSIFVQFAFGGEASEAAPSFSEMLRRPRFSALGEMGHALFGSSSSNSDDSLGDTRENQITNAVPPDVLRQALAVLCSKEGRFQLKETDDAAEALDAILQQLHLTAQQADSQGPLQVRATSMALDNGDTATAGSSAAARR